MLHPPSDSIDVAAISVDVEAVLDGLKSFPKGIGCGRDGLRTQHLLDALSGAAAVAEELLLSITGVVNLLLAAKCPSVLVEYIASAPLTPLLKPGGGLRPIVVGTVWRRLLSKMAPATVGNKMPNYLGYHQFGVGTPCGGEGILHSVNMLLELKGNETNLSMLLIDFTNAFNLVDRITMIREVRNQCPGISRWVEFRYAKPARLYFGDAILSSVQGVQQRHPLGPLLFALTLHPLVLKIASLCTIVADTLEVAKALGIVHNEGQSRGLHLNISKTELFWPFADPRSTVEGMFPATIGRPSVGVKLLGGPVSLDVQFCSDMVRGRVNKTIHSMSAIRQLQDPQSELLLLRNCTGVSRLYFTMRTTNPLAVQHAQDYYGTHLFQYLRQLN